QAIVPIGALFSATLIFSNLAYLHLSVAFIQMLKATTPVVVLLLGWTMGTEKPNMTVLYKVLVIVFGVALASYGEINFVVIGVIFQALGIIFEAARLVMVQQLLHQYKMDPLCSLYHFAPVCAVMNGLACIVFEGSLLNVEAFATIGPATLFANACVAFALNCAVVFLIGKTSSLVMCLSGIAKDIILVAVSSILWATPIGGWQIIGYGITLAGMVWYKNLSLFNGKSLYSILPQSMNGKVPSSPRRPDVAFSKPAKPLCY
ncbi:triose-phosphate transporter family-domain-containing protein, partial [Geranomyces variabilis]